ncbi:1747_t:CDS:2, partial [Scutellospora calospora]
IHDEGISNISCQALGYLANNDSLHSFSNTKDNSRDFDKWARSKEYRGYIHIPSFRVSYDAKSYISSDSKDPDYSDQHNPTQNPEKVVNTERNPYGYMKEYTSKEVSKQVQTELGKFILSGGKLAKDFKIIKDRNWIIKNIKILLKNFQKDLGLLLSADGYSNLDPYEQDLT